MPACNATYKLAVRFENWRRPGHHFYHPFERMQVGRRLPARRLVAAEAARRTASTGTASSWRRMCDAERNPRHLDGRLDRPGLLRGRGGVRRPHDGRAPGQDAVPVRVPLRGRRCWPSSSPKYAVDRGVRHVVDNVEDVVLDERGWIGHVVTAEHGDLHGDLFIDCTGFRGLLHQQGAAGAVRLLSGRAAQRQRRGAAGAAGHGEARHPAVHDGDRAGRGLDLDDPAVRPHRHRLRLRARLPRAGGGRAGAARVRRPGRRRARGQPHPDAHRPHPQLRGSATASRSACPAASSSRWSRPASSSSSTPSSSS